MAALNWQTPGNMVEKCSDYINFMFSLPLKLILVNALSDKPMQINQGKFMLNGNCGYVLKPDCMLREGFDPQDPNTLGIDMKGKFISLKIIGARHLGRSGRSTTSPSVEVEILGADYDSGIKHTTRTIC